MIFLEVSIMLEYHVFMIDSDIHIKCSECRCHDAVYVLCKTVHDYFTHSNNKIIACEKCIKKYN